MTTNTTTTDLKHTLAEYTPGGAHRENIPPSGKKPKKRGFIWVILLLAVVGIAVYAVIRASQPGLVPASPNAGGGKKGGRGAGAFGPTPVVVVKAKKMNVPVYLTGLGNVAAFYTVTVKTRVDGQLMKVDFKEGDNVKEGQELAQIDPRPYQVQLQQAEGQLARDQAILADAKLDLERYKTLLAQDAIPKQQLDTQVASVGQAEGNVKTDQANINNAKLQLDYALIKAPITGRIGLRLVDPGNIVHASDANGLFVITQIQPISVFFTIPEDTMPQVMKKIRAGMHLPVDAFNRDNSVKLASGTLMTVDNEIDPTTGTAKLKAVFENKDNALFPSQFVNMRLLADTKPNQLVVPSEAIQHGQQGPFVFLMTPDSKSKMVNVTPDIVLDNDLTSIVAGLEEGDQVITQGTDRLQNGSPVRPAKADGSTPPGGGRGRSGKGARGAGAGAPASQAPGAGAESVAPAGARGSGGQHDGKGRGGRNKGDSGK
jgi:multidrug efflux system membrane fusion protein